MKAETKRIKNLIKRDKASMLNPFAIAENIYYHFPKVSTRKIFELVMKTK